MKNGVNPKLGFGVAREKSSGRTFFVIPGGDMASTWVAKLEEHAEEQKTS